MRLPLVFAERGEFYAVEDAAGNCLLEMLKTTTFLYEIEAMQSMVSMCNALRELVSRCDGQEGVRADGSNIDTLGAHAALGDLDGDSANPLS